MHFPEAFERDSVRAMSEAYCVLTRAKIGREAVRAYLDAEWKGAHAYDWRGCTGFIDVESLDERAGAWDEWLAEIDARIDGTYRQGYRRLRGNAPTPNFRFYYDDALGTLTQASVWYAQGASELVWHLALTRGLSQFLRGEERGITAVHDPILGNGTVGVFVLRPGESSLVFDGEGRLDAVTAKAIDDISSEFLAKLERDQLEVRDELDAFI